MKRPYEEDDAGSGAAAALGLCATLMASLIAFWIADAGLFDGPPRARLTFVEKAAKPFVEKAAKVPIRVSADNAKKIAIN